MSKKNGHWVRAVVIRAEGKVQVLSLLHTVFKDFTKQNCVEITVEGLCF